MYKKKKLTWLTSYIFYKRRFLINKNILIAIKCLQTSYNEFYSTSKMSLTPGGIKSSPFGIAINKNLLTPCRRVGLSRKKTTPNSISKILSQDLNNSNSSTSENTPVNQNVCIKRKKRNAGSNSITNSSKKVESGVKKILDNCFHKDENAIVRKVSDEKVEVSVEKNIKISPNKEIKCFETVQKTLDSGKKNSDGFPQNAKMKSSNSEYNKLLPMDENVNTENDVYPLSVDNNSAMEAKFPDSHNILNISSVETSSTIIGPLVELPLKRKILYDSDDEFKITENITAKLKTYERKTTIDKSNYISSDIPDAYRDCTINIKKLSEQEITDLTENSAEKTEMILSDEEDICVIKKKRFVIMDDEDDDFQDFIEKSVKPTNEVVEKVAKNKDSLKIKNKKLPKVTSLTLGNSFEDEDDAFTSTPDREKNEKRELISQIKAMEKNINDKKIKLENLTRASLYKSKHNVEELKNITEIWRQGCTLGLEGLLKQLQSHGPMDMSTLLKNLQISQETASKVFINVI